MNEIIKKIEDEICLFLETKFGIDVNENSKLIGKESAITSLSVMELIAWVEEKYDIVNILDDDLYLDCLSSIHMLALKIGRLKGYCHGT